MSDMHIDSSELPPEYVSLPPVHPGEILREDFLEPLDLSAYKLAQHLGVPQQRITDLVSGGRRISADTALRLGRYFQGDARRGARFWLALQARYDLEEALADSVRCAAVDAIEPRGH